MRTITKLGRFDPGGFIPVGIIATLLLLAVI
jgi:hypothetical protein